MERRLFLSFFVSSLAREEGRYVLSGLWEGYRRARCLRARYESGGTEAGEWSRSVVGTWNLNARVGCLSVCRSFGREGRDLW